MYECRCAHVYQEDFNSNGILICAETTTIIALALIQTLHQRSVRTKNFRPSYLNDMQF